MEFAVVADSIARGAAFELSPLKEPAGAPVRLGVLERSTVEEPVKDPVPVEVFELIRLSAEPETGPFRPVLFVPKIAEPEPPEALELSAGRAETPAPLLHLQVNPLIRIETPPPEPKHEPPPAALARESPGPEALAT